MSSIVGSINVANLTDLTYRAVLMADNVATDPQEFVEALGESVDSYLAITGDETLKDDVCGAVNALAAAAATLAVNRTENFVEALMAGQFALDVAEHALIHSDPMAVECFVDGQNSEEWMSNIVEWVTAHLPESDPDAFLASLELEDSNTNGSTAA